MCMTMNKKILKIIGGACILCAIIVKPSVAAMSVAQAFYELARQNSVQRIRSLIHRGYSLESTDRAGYTPLCLAIKNQNALAYSILRSYGANKYPKCLKYIPKKTYTQFFGYAPTVGTGAVYSSDTPYFIGATVLGAGALVGAYLLRGDSNGDGGDEPIPPTPEGKECSGYGHKVDGHCVCNSGYGNFNDDTDCYKEVENCSIQDKSQCSQCKSGFVLQNNKCVPSSTGECRDDQEKKNGKCVCKAGSKDYGDITRCYKDIPGCVDQFKETCSRCDSDKILANNQCYDKIKDCKDQVEDKCNECEGDAVLAEDKGQCYQKIDDCTQQVDDICIKCADGKVLSDNGCYTKVEDCIEQIHEVCKTCRPGYTKSSEGLKCFKDNPCEAIEHTVPNKEGQCVCDASKGYGGEPGACTRAESGNYQEGDGNQEIWNNYNELYCNSHGLYEVITAQCLCYKGYSGDDCSTCAENYKEFGGACFAEKTCGEGEEQSYDKCVCDSEHVNYTDREGVQSCIPKIECELHYEQDGVDACKCKSNFNEECTDCKEGYKYDPVNDICIYDKQCEGKWSGDNCDICPSNFEVTEDGECGTQCASNRAPWDEEYNSECTVCADGYSFSPTDNNCIKNECTTGSEGYKGIYDESGNIIACSCDAENDYRADVDGKCVKAAPPLIGQKTGNINNDKVVVENDGVLRDVYGMKPLQDENDEDSYYDNIYNALSSEGEKTGSINITNKNTGNNKVYGIYSQSELYNAAVINRPESTYGASAIGTITITDENTSSQIYGMFNSDNYNIYNSFTYASSQDTPTNNTSKGIIEITKDTTGSGEIIGMMGGRNLYNAYVETDNGLNANVSAEGYINITHQGTGDIYGIKGTNGAYKINNAFAYMNSLVSTTEASGIITMSGQGNVYGIYGIGGVTNSETQFSRSFTIIPEFSSYGKIDVTSSTNKVSEAAYGIYTEGSSSHKASLYNAFGYNSTGDVIVKNEAGGSAYGLYSKQQTYAPLEGSEQIYNETFNAFRSSQRYGGDNVAATGNIKVTVEGYSSLQHNIVGIFAEGNVYNAFTNSGSDIVKLESVGNILIEDNSQTSSVRLFGIESNGKTIANAYSKGVNDNTLSNTVGTITVTENVHKNDTTRLAGIYSNKQNPQGGAIYNAALIDNQSTVSGTITVSSADGIIAPSHMYGIYAANDNVSESGKSQPKTVYNAYYENNNDEEAGGKVVGRINVTANNISYRPDVGYYGIYVKEGNAYNAYSSNANADVKGIINVIGYGGASQNNNEIAGMYGLGSDTIFATLNNSGNSEINVTSKGSAVAYGIKGEKAYIYNDALIKVDSGNSTAYGIYINKGSAINDEHGSIVVSGGQVNYGIYAVSDDSVNGEVSVENKGNIIVNGANGSSAIYASGPNASVINSGTLTVNGSTCTGADCPTGAATSQSNAGIKLVNGAQYINKGLMVSDTEIDFDKMGGEIVLAEGGQFVAEEAVKGLLNVAATVVLDSFEKKEVLSEAISTENIEDLQLKSQSYLYNTTKKQVDDDKYDVVLTMKDFKEVTNSDKAAYYSLNYENKNNSKLFNALKTTSNAAEFNQREADISGTSVIPNIAQENLKVARSLDRKMLSELFREGDDIRKMVGADGLYIGRETHGTLSGYDIESQSMYALYDKKLNNKYRLGLGMSITNTDTDYNNDSTRKSFMVQGYVPLTYTNMNGLTAVTMARLGYSDGEYKRYGFEKRYEADTNEITYGLLNEVRYKINLGRVNLTPFVGLNAIGYYQDKIDEGNEDFALHIASSHIFSLESALGLYLDKYIEFNEDNKLNIALGIGWYHEFADPYRGMNARIKNTLGSYKLRDIEHINSRNRGVLSAKVNYDYKNFSVTGELMQYLEEEYPIQVDVGLKYKF